MSGDGLPSSFRLAASRALRPLQQGELDGLCGIYSLINAVRLVRHREVAMSAEELASLFSFAMFRLAEDGDFPNRLSTGVPWPALKRLGRKLMSAGSTKALRLELVVLRRGGDDRLVRMKRALMDGAALITSVAEGEHYSVVVGWTPTRAVLFDSGAGQWVPLASIRKSLCFAIRFEARD